MELLHSGKVRDVYADGDDLLLVASDRISIYDVVLPTPIPDKGKILTQLSLWWFDQLSDVAPNHIRSATDVPDEWRGRAVRCERLAMVMVECIARGYLAGSGLKDYAQDRAIAGNPLPEGLAEGSRLPEPIFTPSTKVAPGATFVVGVKIGSARRDPSISPSGSGTPETARSFSYSLRPEPAR